MKLVAKYPRTLRALTLATTLAVAAASVVVSDQLASASPSHSAPAPAAAPHLHAVPHTAIAPGKTDLEFVPTSPCRIADTRHGGGAIHREGTRSFQVTGSSGFSGQGGLTGGCGIPSNAKSVALTVTSLDETAAGAITAYPSGTTRPFARTLSFSRGVASTASTLLRVGSGGRITAYNVSTAGSTDLLLDVNGYYEEQIEGLVYTGGSASGAYSGTPRILSVTNVSPGVADVTIDQDVNDCTPSVSPYYSSNAYASASAFNGNKVRVFTWYLDSTTHNPVLANQYVYLKVTC